MGFHHHPPSTLRQDKATTKNQALQRRLPLLCDHEDGEPTLPARDLHQGAIFGGGHEWGGTPKKNGLKGKINIDHG